MKFIEQDFLLARLIIFDGQPWGFKISQLDDLEGCMNTNEIGCDAGYYAKAGSWNVTCIKIYKLDIHLNSLIFPQNPPKLELEGREGG